jgi:metal-responsive CopG/Arc/MetJ family transcriptional regulator
METIKTAISLQKSLYKETDELAKQLKLSRSKIISLALEEYILLHRNRKLLEQLNEAYADQAPVEEVEILGGMRKQQKKLTEGEWS